MNISELIIKSGFILPLKGHQKGKCIICYKETSIGNKFKDILSARFTNYNLLYKGDCICENCSACIKEPILRRSNWIVTENDFFQLKYSDFLNKLLEINQNGPYPYSAFVTTSFKKHGWLNHIYAFNTNNTAIIVIYEENLVRMTTDLVNYFSTLIISLKQYINKEALLSFNISNKQFLDIVEQGLLKQFNEYKKYKNNLGLELLINLL